MSHDPRPDADPLAAYPAGTQLDELRTAESFLVVAVRFWTARRLEPNAGHGDWRTGFRAAGVCDIGAACFGSFLNIIEAAAYRPITLGCPHCGDVTEDEARLLCVVGLLQRERGNDAALLLADWLPPAAVRVAADYAFGFATALSEARLTMPERRPEARPRPAAPRRFIHHVPLSVVH
ncbi:MAG TPA: hypothetical protein VGO34_16165 [Alphaproteobacteria bacterium]